MQGLGQGGNIHLAAGFRLGKGKGAGRWIVCGLGVLGRLVQGGDGVVQGRPQGGQLHLGLTGEAADLPGSGIGGESQGLREGGVHIKADGKAGSG